MSSADVNTSTTFLRTWAPLMAVCTGFFVVVLDSTMMNVAVPAIAKDLGTTVSGVQAAIALYSMVMASLMLVGGKLGDIYGVKRMFMVGMGLYGAGTFLAASSFRLMSRTLWSSCLDHFLAMAPTLRNLRSSSFLCSSRASLSLLSRAIVSSVVSSY